MASRSVFVFFVQILLLQVALSKPFIGGRKLNSLVSTPLVTSVVPTNALSGSVSQLVAPGVDEDWHANSHAVPLITEIEPNLQVGEITAGGEMPITGSIKITGLFPVFGSVGVQGNVPTHGKAYVDVGNAHHDCSA